MRNNCNSTIYSFKLNNLDQIVFAEVINLSQIREFDGILVTVFKDLRALEDASDFNVSEGVIGPLPINRIPTVKGKYAWKNLGESQNTTINPEDLWFKKYHGALGNCLGWHELRPWYKYRPFFDNKKIEIWNYEEIRPLETMILQHTEMVKIKAEMIILIENGLDIADYYNLKELGIRNIFLQVINTYFPKEIVENLINKLKSSIEN